MSPTTQGELTPTTSMCWVEDDVSDVRQKPLPSIPHTHLGSMKVALRVATRKPSLESVRHRPPDTMGTMQAKYCTFEHRRSVPAVVRVWVKSAKAGKPGHPVSRELMLCAKHATELRRMGGDLVDA